MLTISSFKFKRSYEYGLILSFESINLISSLWMTYFLKEIHIVRETKWDGIWRKNTFIVQYYERVRNLSQWNRRWKLPNLQQSMRIHVTNICCIIWNEKGTTFGEPVQTFVIPILRCPNRRSPQPPSKATTNWKKPNTKGEIIHPKSEQNVTWTEWRRYIYSQWGWNKSKKCAEFTTVAANA